ncbi:RNA recognition motif domain-containing protein, partial [Bacteroidota bacterium]
ENELQDLFQSYGTVSSVKIIRDHQSGRAKGYAFVDMEEETEGLTAIENLNQKEAFGRTLKVSQAKEKTNFGTNNNFSHSYARREDSE